MRRNARWRNDIFSDLYNNDALYAYTIRASEEFCLLDWEKLRDPVLHRLLGMGLLDWVDKDDRPDVSKDIPPKRTTREPEGRIGNKEREEARSRDMPNRQPRTE